ncbi:MAG: TetR/AcrR family transcriptional regulator [Proteobacteria bacterium]|nr:TetR/AcrR family transcriptional regulator [Pseudomonadota bacterium]MBU1641464.1 TetR/AcrR family transcriptional regulator [Pseudomonadota bacterium]
MAQMNKGEKTRDHILKTTRAIIVANGFHNTSISAIIEATGVKKGNLYYHFASKDDIGLAVLEDAKEEFFTFLAESFKGDSPCAKVIHSCRAIFKEQKKNNFVGGCLFGNAALEMSDNNSRFAEVIHEVFSRWVAEIERYLLLSGDGCSQHLKLAPHLLAKTIVATMEGGIMMSRVSKDQTDLEDCLTVIGALLGE